MKQECIDLIMEILGEKAYVIVKITQHGFVLQRLFSQYGVLHDSVDLFRF